MKALEAIHTITSATEKAEAEGHTVIPILPLKEFLANLKEIAASSPESVAEETAALEAFRASLSEKSAARQIDHEQDLELMRATISTALGALRSAVLINGGGSVALLAFIGNIWSADNLTVASLAIALIYFVAGVGTGASASFFAYLAQAGFGHELGTCSIRLGEAFRGVAALAIISSYLLFGIGAYKSYTAFVGL
jgi:hypothetical protein